MIDGGEVRVNFWDLSGRMIIIKWYFYHYTLLYHHDDHESCIMISLLSGHPEFFEIRNEFYKDTQGALLVYDVTNAESFDALDSWLAEAQKFGCNPKVNRIIYIYIYIYVYIYVYKMTCMFMYIGNPNMFMCKQGW